MINKILKQINNRISNDEYRFRILLLGSIVLFVSVAIIALIINIIYNARSLMASSIVMILFGTFCAFSCHYFKSRINLVGDVFIIVVTIILFLLPLDGLSDSYFLVWPVVYPMWVLLLYQRKKGTIYTFSVLGILMLLFWTPLNAIKALSGYNPEYAIRVIVAMLSTYFLVLMFESVRISLVDKLKESKKRYETLSKFDTLTGLHNRYVFNRRIEKRLVMNSEVGKEMSLFMIDLDDFKKCNDIGGHFFGDYVLRKAAEVMKGMMRPEDLICRWGGEEFVVIIEGINEAKSRQRAEEIRLRMQKEKFIKEDNNDIQSQLTVSIGFVHFIPTKDTKAEIIATLADEYMYQAKKNGKNRVEGASVNV